LDDTSLLSMPWEQLKTKTQIQVLIAQYSEDDVKKKVERLREVEKDAQSAKAARAVGERNPYLEDSETEFSHTELEALEPVFGDHISRVSEPRPVTDRLRKSQIDSFGRVFARGYRKTATAHVWLRRGTGEHLVNGKPYHEYFRADQHRAAFVIPFEVTDTLGTFDCKIKVEGGGFSGRSEAVQLGIVRCLAKWNPEWRTLFKRSLLSWRDGRQKEAKKTGRKGARKAFQWVKR